MNELRYSAKLVLHRDVKFFGPGVVELLQRVHLCHSLHKASKEMSMAYTKALKLVKTAETNLGFKLLNQKIGGISGGGSKLTPEAKKIIALYEAFDAKGKRIDKGYTVQCDAAINPVTQLADGLVKAKVGLRVSSVGDKIEVDIVKSNLTNSVV